MIQNMRNTRFAAFLTAFGLMAFGPMPFGATAAAHADDHAAAVMIEAGPNVQETLLEALILAKPGQTIKLAAGLYELTDGLSLDVDNVTIEGAGMDETILSFKGQQGGAEGLLVTSDNVTLKDFAVEDAAGDAIKSKGADNIKMLNLRTEWTNGPDENNGAYGLYPVESVNVLIDGCVAIGASDAGIYVGQSRNIIVRNSRAEYNVAGIEIENSFHADVHDNVATNNTGGLLIFDLPGLPQLGGHTVRAFDNTITGNNTPNFAPKGNIVAGVPAGTGVIVMANRNVHLFDNEIGDNQSTNVLINAYGRSESAQGEAAELEAAKAAKDGFVPVPRDIFIYDNMFGKAGWEPTGSLAPYAASVGGALPSVICDGVSEYVVGTERHQVDVNLVIKDNTGNASFLSFGLGATDTAPDAAQPSTDLAAHAGEIPAIGPVTFDTE